MSFSTALSLLRNVDQWDGMRGFEKEGGAPGSAQRIFVVGKTCIIAIDTLNVYRLASIKVPFFKIAEISTRCAVIGLALYLRLTAQQSTRETLNTIAQQSLNITRLFIELANPAFANNPQWLVVSSIDVGLRVQSLINKSTSVVQA